MHRVAARLLEKLAAVAVLALTLPLVMKAMLAIWLADGGPPIYRAPRVGRGGRDFTMFKLRTMVVNADRLGGRFALETDPRITRAGARLRRWKIDEIPQFWNVLRGEMAIVGPRPDVRSGVERYTPEEMRLLEVRPGITGMASLLFFDEGRMLAGASDPLAHHMVTIRPLKGRLDLLQVERNSASIDMRIAGLTALRLVRRDTAFRGIAAMLRDLDAEDDLQALCRVESQTAILSGAAGAVRG